MKAVPHGTYNGYRNYGCRCETCKEAHSDYQRRMRDRWKESQRRSAREWARRNPRKRREYLYGLSPDEHDALIASGCGICRAVVGMSDPVDHDHATGRVRGVLCPRCNQGLGKFGDDVATLKSAIQYLRGSQT